MEDLSHWGWVFRFVEPKSVPSSRRHTRTRGARALGLPPLVAASFPGHAAPPAPNPRTDPSGVLGIAWRGRSWGLLIDMPRPTSSPSRRKVRMAGAKKPPCGAKKRNGELCGREKGWGTDHLGTGRCKHHSGSTSNGLVAAAREQCQDMATPLPVTPGQAITGVLHLTAGQLAFATAMVATLKDKELWDDSIGGPIPSRWIRLQQSLQDRLARYSAQAHGMGISERQTQLAEQQTAMLGDLLESVLGELELTPAQRKQVGPAIRRNLEVVPGTAHELPVAA